MEIPHSNENAPAFDVGASVFYTCQRALWKFVKLFKRLKGRLPISSTLKLRRVPGLDA